MQFAESNETLKIDPQVKNEGYFLDVSADVRLTLLNDFRYRLGKMVMAS